MCYILCMNIRTYLLFNLLSLGLISCTIKEPSSETEENSHTTYSWIELYVDGSRDTVFAEDTSNYPTQMNWMYTEKMLTLDTNEAASSHKPDTIYLNYGSDARDTLTEPKVRILNKQQILDALDTVLLNQPMLTSATISATHFRGDRLEAQLSDTSTMALLISPSTEICRQSDPCSLPDSISCTNITFDSSVKFTNALGIAPDKADSNIIHWKIKLVNRFGYTDSLEGSSIVQYPILECETPQVTQCQELSVHVRRDTLYSWVEAYADGHLDTIWNADSSLWPGPSSVSLFNAIWNRDLVTLQEISIPETRLICPGDSLMGTVGYNPLTLYEKPDTIRLNYSHDSLFPLVQPRIEFQNPDSLLSLTDTVQYFTRELRQSVHISHFRGDSAQIEAVAPSPVQIGFAYSTEGGCRIQNPCWDTKVQICMDVDYGPYAETWPYLTMPVDSTSSGIRNWTLIARNRFGYADTLNGSTQVLPLSCPATTVLSP